MKIGVLCPSEIAFRRFMPALQKQSDITYAGVAHANAEEWFGTPTESQLLAEHEKALRFQEAYGGQVYSSYASLLADSGVDAVYVPLPPALHYEWGNQVLQAGKHLFMEKPFTTCPEDTKALVALAEEKGLAIHENYMFLYHSQLDWIKAQLAGGAIGELRLIRAAFGFPFRGANDFRYNKDLGGGALLDCGGYPIRLAAELLGETARITSARLNQGRGLDVDVYGSAVLENAQGQTAQISFGMDNSYKCELELWGSTGYLHAGRIFTAPVGFAPTVTIQTQDGTIENVLPEDDSFLNSICLFSSLVADPALRATSNQKIVLQSTLVETTRKEGSPE